MAAYRDDRNSNFTGAVRWFGSLDSSNDYAALCSPAAHMWEPPWSAQRALPGAAVAKKEAPANVSRKDTPTSVFDFFGALDISTAALIAPLPDQHPSHQHNTGAHAAACFY